MEDLAKKIITRELNIYNFALEEIAELGQVNKVYAITSARGAFILRLNGEAGKTFEYQKEKWCIEAADKLGIPSPTVLKYGKFKEVFFMLQARIPGVNGGQASVEEKLGIWQQLGAYAKVFHAIPQIEDTAVTADEFHASWKHRLAYNLAQLNETDSLLHKGIISSEDMVSMKNTLRELGKKNFSTGLVHGDLCPRNTIWQRGNTYLLDWGMAEINIVPHTEIGIVLRSKTANQAEFLAFLTGLGYSAAAYAKIEQEVMAVSFLHHLDKYRWAEGHVVENIGDYEKMVVSTFSEANQ